MRLSVKAVPFTAPSPLDASLAARYGFDQAKAVAAYHESFPQYHPTPLVSLEALAETLGVQNIWVKDESPRFGLNAFKVLGGSYCIGRCLAERLSIRPEELSYELLTSPGIRERLGTLTFVTATDGNHGRGVAWTAACLGHKSVVYMPKGSSPERLANIRALGADASITELNYDDTVRFARQMARENGWILVQDTAWEGYEAIPTWIMQGYTTIGYEIIRQLEEAKPTHLFLQAGVGSLAGALSAFFAGYYGENAPVISIVEPHQADCLYRTAQANDGALHAVTGDLDSIMAGLCCGEPCTLAWEILQKTASHFFSIPDCMAARGMRILGNPTGNDRRIISGESGAATLGLVSCLLQDEELEELRCRLGLTSDSRILCISTEGDTDREHYRRIVWDGLYPSF